MALLVPMQARAQSCLPVRFIVLGATLFALLMFLLLHKNPQSQSQSHSPTSIAHDAPSATRDVIPNQVHFVYVLANSNSEFAFKFSDFLSIYAVWHYWKPHAIFLHTNAKADSRAVARARDGSSGKWAKYIFTLFDLKIHTVAAPTHAGNGRAIGEIEHKSDFIRVQAVHDFGGVYVDFDAHALRDIKHLRESGFDAIGGRQLHGQVISGTFMSKKGSKMIALFMMLMHEAYTGGWTTHSNEVITRVGERLAGQPGEMLIMDREAFAPWSWEIPDMDRLYAVQKVKSNLHNISQGDALPSYEEGFFDRWEHPERFPKWERDWSTSYLLHAFNPDRFEHKVPGFDHVTPKYVLARQSNFARAVYPVAKVMYERGLIQFDDTYTGK